MEQAIFTVWIDEKNKLVSFRREDGFREKQFESREDFVTFITIYSAVGYRFQ